MALFKTIVASGTIITPNGLAAQNISATNNETYTYASVPDVFSNTVSTSTALQPSNHVTNPGVFTVGTAFEGTVTNTTNDSRS